MVAILNKVRKILTGEKGVIATLGLLGFFVFIGLMLAGGFATFTQYSNSMEFCISCHEMESTVYQEYKESHHFKTRVGVRPSCADCHVPYQGWTSMVIHKIGATKELFYHLTGKIDTPEKFEAHRLELAQNVWARMKGDDSAACRGCHKVEAWDYKLQRRRSVVQHEEMVETGETCIDCHKGIAHKSVHEELEEEDEGFDDFEDFDDFE